MFSPLIPDHVMLAILRDTELSTEETSPNFLHPLEIALLSPKASIKRRREFILGRLAAHAALKQIGVTPGLVPILQGEKGEPLWPNGIVGSITHAAGFAAAAVARTEKVRALGIDLIAEYRPMPPEISRHICVPQEQAWISADPEAVAWRLHALFSAKESLFKALYPICKCYISFKDVTLVWSEQENRFNGRLNKDLSKDFRTGFCFEIGLESLDRMILTQLVVRA